MPENQAISSSPSEPVVRVRDLTKTFRSGLRRTKIEAVRGLSFEVGAGEVFGIVGPNGAGKTTTMKVLCGLIEQTSGEAELFGIPTGEVRSRQRLGYLPEGPYFYEHLNVRELLSYYGGLLGMTRAEVRARAPQLIERVGLGHAASRPIRKFSKGMRQRAGLAQALLHDPDLVILDEPQSGLDPIGRRDVRDIIFELKEQKKTVIFSSHVLPDVEAVCDRVALFHQGTIVEIGSLDELLQRRTRGYEVVATDVPPGVALTDLTERAERGRLVELHFAPGADLGRVAAELAQLGASLQSIRPLRDDLSEVFLRDTAAVPSPAES